MMSPIICGATCLDVRGSASHGLQDDNNTVNKTPYEMGAIWTRDKNGKRNNSELSWCGHHPSWIWHGEPRRRGRRKSTKCRHSRWRRPAHGHHGRGRHHLAWYRLRRETRRRRRFREYTSKLSLVWTLIRRLPEWYRPRRRSCGGRERVIFDGLRSE